MPRTFAGRTFATGRGADDDDAEDVAEDRAATTTGCPRRRRAPASRRARARPGSMRDCEGVPVYRLTGTKTGETVTLPGRIFDVPLRVDIAHRVVVWQRNKRRRGLHKTKTRAEVRGTTKKARPQKGGGRARVGDLRAPQMRGGGVAHGPVVRSHETGLQRKVRRLGLKIALSAKLAEGRVVVLDNAHEDVLEAKTKWLDQALDALLGAGALAAGDRQHSVLLAEIRRTNHARRCSASGRSIAISCQRLSRAPSARQKSAARARHAQRSERYDILQYRSLDHKDALKELVSRIDAPTEVMRVCLPPARGDERNVR